MTTAVMLACDCAAAVAHARATGERAWCACGAVVEPRLAARPARERVFTVADLEWFAGNGWVPRFYGRACGVEPTIRGSVQDRGGREDERTRDFHRAAAIHRRLERMRTGAGCLHYSVLTWCFVERSDVRSRGDGFLAELGFAFAPPALRARWLRAATFPSGVRRSVLAARQREHGRGIYDAAVAAWRAP